MARRLHAIDATSSPRPQRLDGVEAHEGLRNSSQDSRSHRLISTQARAEDDGVDRPAQRARRPADGPGVDVRAPGVRGRDVGPQQQGPGAATLARRAKGGLLGAAALAATPPRARRRRGEAPRARRHGLRALVVAALPHVHREAQRVEQVPHRAVADENDAKRAAPSPPRRPRGPESTLEAAEALPQERHAREHLVVDQEARLARARVALPVAAQRVSRALRQRRDVGLEEELGPAGGAE